MRVSIGLLLLSLLFVPQLVRSDSPIQEGGQCFDDGAIFISTVSERTPWSVVEIVAVPVDIVKPEDWDLYSAIEEQIAAQLPSSPGPAGFAQATVAVWKNFLSDQADVLVNLQRAITKTDTTLRCNISTWVYVSVSTSTLIDRSDWSPVQSTPFNINSQQSVDTLTIAITNFLSDLNSQPGAQNNPQQ